MTSSRLEAFSDGVIAIIITIMVLELKIPHGYDWKALIPAIPVFLTYVMSFMYLGIYWNNHHHMIFTAKRVNGKILWANMHLLFWLSLIPFVTGWMGENHFASEPTALYGVILLMAAIAYSVLQGTIISMQGKNSKLKKAIGRDFKGRASIWIYMAAIALAFWNHWVAVALYILVAFMWLIPDRRIESIVAENETS